MQDYGFLRTAKYIIGKENIKKEDHKKIPNRNTNVKTDEKYI